MLSLLLTTALALAANGAAAAAPAAGDKFEDLKSAFERAAQGSDAAARSAAVEALVASGNTGAMPVFLVEFTRVTEVVDEQEAKALRSRALVERKEYLIEQWKLRATHDEAARPALEREQKALAEERKELDKLERRLGAERPWRAEISGGASRLLAAVGPEKRRKPEAELLADANEHPNAPVRNAAIDLLGAAGGLDSGLALARLAQSLGESCEKLEERLPKLMADVHKMEARLAKEAGQTDNFSKGTYDQYDAVKRDAAEVRRKIFQTSRQSSRAARAAADALSRGSGKDLDEAAATLVRAWKKGKGRARRAALEVISLGQVEPVRAAARAQLAAETEPLSRAEWIDVLAAQGDPSCVPELLQKHLVDPAWIVRAHAASALARLRSRDAIPALIARLSLEEGRLRSDIGRALTSLTEKDFKGNVELWQRWWKENEPGFVVPPLSPEKTALEEAKEAVGVSFFGISTESQRVLFVIDCSKSMDFSMTPKNNPTDDPDRPYDMPDESKGEYSRLTAAKRDLLKALSGIKDGGEFNIVCYAADTWSWSDTPEVMAADSRKEAIQYVEKLEGAAGTNIYSALEKAFDLAGAKPGSAWTRPAFDTIFFLTDGRATIGVTTNTEEILAYVRERNANTGIVVHTIGLSGAQDADLMRRLAAENGGQYVAR